MRARHPAGPSTLITGSLAAMICLCGWFLQSRFLLNIDVSWLLEASQRMLSGGNYTRDFFENNPPWILYVYALPVFLTKLTPASLIVAFGLFVYLTGCVSLAVCWSFLKRIFQNDLSLFPTTCLVALAIIFFIQPMPDFGQREHLAFIVSMPWFLLLTLRAERKTVSRRTAFLTGLFAGTGFLIKPYFLFAPFFIELYYYAVSRKIRPVRPETVAVFLLGLIYIFILFVRHPDYLQFILPVAAHWCYQGIRMPLPLFFSYGSVIFCTMALLLYPATYELHPCRAFFSVMTLALTGYLLAFFIQGTAWRYHMLPAWSMCLLLYGYFFSLLATNPSTNGYVCTKIGILFLLYSALLFRPIIRYTFLWQTMRHPAVLAGYEILLFSLVYFLSVRKPAVLSFLACVLIPPITGLIFLSLSGVLCYWTIWRVPLACLLSILIFCSLLPCPSETKNNRFLVTLAGFLLFFYPFHYGITDYTWSRLHQAPILAFSTWLDQHALHKPVYTLSTNPKPLFPALTYARDTPSASRFSFFWALPGLVKQEVLPGPRQKEPLRLHDKRLLGSLIAADLSTYKPDLVLIDALDNKSSLYFFHKNTDGGYSLKSIPFDYLTYFSDNPDFTRAFRHWHHWTTLSLDTHEPVNPLMYQVAISDHAMPDTGHAILANTIYLYLTADKVPEIAFRDNSNTVRRVRLPLAHIRDLLLQHRPQPDSKTTELIYSTLTDLTFPHSFSRFEVYTRNK